MKLHRVSFLLLGLLGMIGALYAQDPCYSLVWADEFDYTGLPDSDLWDYDIGGGGWGNNELQYYTDRETNASVADGILTITARRESFGNRGYTSTRLVSRGKGDWLYGRFEIRAKLPTGRGTWPAIWMLPTDWEYGGWPASGEIDIMEHVGYDQGEIHGTIHTQAYHHSIGTQKGGSRFDDDVSDDFHVYAIDWSEDRIDWYIDDVKYYTFLNENRGFEEWPFNKRFHLLLNIAVGGSWGGAQGVADDIWPQAMEIDYVRVFQVGVAPEVTGNSYAKVGETSTFAATEYQGDITYTWSVPEGSIILSGQGTKDMTMEWGDTPGTVSVAFEGETGCDQDVAELAVAFVTEPDTDTYTTVAFESGISADWEAMPGSSNEITLTEEADGSIRVDYTVVDVTQNPQVRIPFDELLDLSGHETLQVSLKGEGSTQPVLFYLEDVDGVQTNGFPFLVSLPVSDDFASYSFDYADKWLSNFPVTGADVASEAIAALRLFVNEGSGTFWINGVAVARSADDDDDDEVTGLPARWPSTWKVYPNPAQGSQIRLQADQAPAQLMLFDVRGRGIQLPFQWNQHEALIALPSLPGGLYSLQVLTLDGQYFTQKITLP